MGRLVDNQQMLVVGHPPWVPRNEMKVKVFQLLICSLLFVEFGYSIYFFFWGFTSILATQLTSEMSCSRPTKLWPQSRHFDLFCSWILSSSSSSGSSLAIFWHRRISEHSLQSWKSVPWCKQEGQTWLGGLKSMFNYFPQLAHSLHMKVIIATLGLICFQSLIFWPQAWTQGLKNWNFSRVK